MENFASSFDCRENDPRDAGGLNNKRFPEAINFISNANYLIALWEVAMKEMRRRIWTNKGLYSISPIVRLRGTVCNVVNTEFPTCRELNSNCGRCLRPTRVYQLHRTGCDSLCLCLAQIVCHRERTSDSRERPQADQDSGGWGKCKSTRGAGT